MNQSNLSIKAIFITAFFSVLTPSFTIGAESALSGSAPLSLRSPINQEGPEAWPEDRGLSTSSSQQNTSAFIPGQQSHLPAQDSILPNVDENPLQPISPAPVETPNLQNSYSGSIIPEETQPTRAPLQTAQPSSPLPANNVSASGNAVHGIVEQEKKEKEEPQREVIYVDEAGNPVDKPADPQKMYEEAIALHDQGKFDDALALFDQLKAMPRLPGDLREKTLYGISDALWNRYLDNPLSGYEPIVASTNEAMNANIRSPRVPDALLRLGLANINVDNLPEANGYIMGLLRRFPDYPGVAQGLTALGQAQLKKKQNTDAEKSFSIVLDKFPESSQLQDASVGLAHALFNQGKNDQAQLILDFISKRWPRYYINDPDYLLMQAANNEKTGRLDEAMNWNWLYVNLNPRRPANAPLLLKMADQYMKDNNPTAANFIYSNVQDYFPGTDPAITSRIRLAEQGIHDSPITYDEMTQVFAKNGKQGLWPLYNEMSANKSTNPDEVLTMLKKAMWQYWNKQYPEAMGSASEFIDNYPEHKDIQEARNILWNAFQDELDQSLREHNYGRILLLWNGFPYIRDRYGKIDPPLRYALSQGWLEQGDEKKSFDLLEEFLKGPMDANYGEAAFTQFFNKYIQNSQWDKILELGEKVKKWPLSTELANQLQYAEALSSQNLNLGAAALNRWKDLSHKTDIPLFQQAYATYFLAKDAESRRDIRNAYELNRKVVEMFNTLANERSDKANPEIIKESIASLMDICEVGNRVPEALQWLERYNVFVPQESPEYPGLRFREARLYRKLGDNARAQALLEDIANRFPESPFAQAAAAELRTFEMSRDLHKYVSGTPHSNTTSAVGSTSGNWSSSTPAQ